MDGGINGEEENDLNEAAKNINRPRTNELTVE